MPDQTKVVEKAVALRAAETELWNAFVMAMREYAAGVAAEMLKHPPETLQRAQGQALAANEISTMLHAAPQLLEKMKERKHG